MLKPLSNDIGQFRERILQAHTAANSETAELNSSDLNQWMEYWNDAESVDANLSKVRHWLQRARIQQS